MAQILKFQEGGTLTIDGVKYDINDHLISQYRFLGNEFDDSDQKKYFRTYVNNGLQLHYSGTDIGNSDKLWKDISGKGNDGQIGAEDRRVGNTQSGGGCHGVVQGGLHHQTGNGKSRAGNESRQHPGYTDVPDDAVVGCGSLLCQGGQRVGKGHVGGTGKQTRNAQDHHTDQHCENDGVISFVLLLKLLYMVHGVLPCYP